MYWNNDWMILLGRNQWLGLDMGFWLALAAVTLIVIIMNVVFWSMKPLHENTKNKDKGL